MKNIERFLTHACTYAILILTLLYGFTKLSGYHDTSIAFPSYFIVVTFGFVVSAAEWLLSIEKLHAPVRVLLHYLVLLACFSVMYIAIMKPNASGIMMCIVFFSILYFVFFAFINLIKKGLDKTFKTSGRKENCRVKEKTPYKSMFDGNK